MHLTRRFRLWGVPGRAWGLRTHCLPSHRPHTLRCAARPHLCPPQARGLLAPDEADLQAGAPEELDSLLAPGPAPALELEDVSIDSGAALFQAKTPIGTGNGATTCPTACADPSYACNTRMYTANFDPWCCCGTRYNPAAKAACCMGLTATYATLEDLKAALRTAGCTQGDCGTFAG